MGRRGYPPEFRRKVLDLVEAGRSVAGVARDLGDQRPVDLGHSPAVNAAGQDGTQQTTPPT